MYPELSKYREFTRPRRGASIYVSRNVRRTGSGPSYLRLSQRGESIRNNGKKRTPLNSESE